MVVQVGYRKKEGKIDWCDECEGTSAEVYSKLKFWRYLYALVVICRIIPTLSLKEAYKGPEDGVELPPLNFEPSENSEYCEMENFSGNRWPHATTNPIPFNFRAFCGNGRALKRHYLIISWSDRCPPTVLDKTASACRRKFQHESNVSRTECVFNAASYVFYFWLTLNFRGECHTHAPPSELYSSTVTTLS